MKTHLTTLLTLLSLLAKAQPEVTLTDAYEAARANYPLLKQKVILQQTGELAIQTLNTNRRMPQLNVSGQATWQSQVTTLPVEMPGLSIPPPSAMTSTGSRSTLLIRCTMAT